MPAMNRRNTRRAAGVLALLPAAALLLSGGDDYFPPRYLSSSSVWRGGDGQSGLDDGIGGDPMPSRELTYDPSQSSAPPCDGRRRLQEGGGAPCTPLTPYVDLPKAKAGMPRIDKSVDRMSPPTHVKLCRELLERDELVKLESSGGGGGPNMAVPKLDAYESEEHSEVCVDHTHTHSALMEVFASSVIAAAGSAAHGLKYSHNCQRTNEHTYREHNGFDATTVQQILPESGLILHPHTVDVENVINLCRGCIQEWDAGPGRLEEGWWGRSHQCILFPQPSSAHWEEGEEGPERAPQAGPEMQGRMDDLNQDPNAERGEGRGSVGGNNPGEVPESEDGGDFFGFRKLLPGRLGGKKKGKRAAKKAPPMTKEKAVDRRAGMGRIHGAHNRRMLQKVEQSDPELQQAKALWTSGGEGEVGRRRPEPAVEAAPEEDPPEEGGAPPQQVAKMWSSGGEGEVGKRDGDPVPNAAETPMTNQGEGEKAQDEPPKWSSGGEGEVGAKRETPGPTPQEPDSGEEDTMQFAARSENGPPQKVSASGVSAQALEDTPTTYSDSGHAGMSSAQNHAMDIVDGLGGAAANLRSILPTVRDRLRFAALDYYPKSSPHPLEAKSGAIVYLDGTTVAVPFYVYTSHIPPFVTSVHILAGPGCARSHLENGEACVEHGKKLRHYLSVFYPQAHVRFDLVASTAAAYSRMVMSRMLMCPPGTVSCLLPALAKPEGTAAVVVESPNRESTYHWFSTLKESSNAGAALHVDDVNLDYIQVVTVDEADTGGGMVVGGAGTDFESTLMKDPPLRTEGCDQIRGKMGEWVPEDLSANPILKGLVNGIKMRGADRFQEERAELEKRRPRGDSKEVTFGGAQGEAKAFKWVETAFPTCQMDELSLPGLCAAVETLGISRIFFLGDVLQGQMVLSLWTLLGLPDYPGHKTMGAWNRVVDCPEPLNDGKPFEIAFARNDDLDDNQRIDVSPSHANYPWIKDYLSGGARDDGSTSKRTLLVASTGAYVHDLERYRRSLDKFVHHTLDALARPDDLVFYRTAAPGHRDCEEVNGARSGVLTEREFVLYNNAAMEEFHNRELDYRAAIDGVVDGAGGGPEFVQASAGGASMQPQGGNAAPLGQQQPTRTAQHGVQVLDVYQMTVRHPDGAPSPPSATETSPQDTIETAAAETAANPPQDNAGGEPKAVHDCAHEYRPGPPDAWNHMLYTKLVDLAQEFKDHQRRHHIW